MFVAVETALAMAIGVLLPVLLFVEFFVFYEEYPGFMDDLGLGKREVSLVLVGSMVGVLLNVPVLVGDSLFFGLNVGGALIPIVLAFHLIWTHRPSFFNLFLAVGFTSVLAYAVTEFVADLGVVAYFPYYLLPPIAAFFLARVLERKRLGRSLALAYAAGTMGTLIGADLVRIPEILGSTGGSFLGAIGGAGSLDLVFLSGLLAAGLVLISSPRKMWKKKRRQGEVEKHLYPRLFLNRAWTAYWKGQYGRALQNCRRAVDLQIEHIAAGRGITGDAEGCLLELRVLPYIVHDYRALCWTTANQEDTRRGLVTSTLLIRDLGRIEREIYQGMVHRALAFLLDSLIVAVIILLAFFPLLPTILPNADLLSPSLMVAILTFIGLAWAIQTTYFTLFECIWGQSPGKRLLKMRVLEEDGGRCGFMAAFTRNVLRILDLTLVFLIFPLPLYLWAYQRSDRRQRIGDYLAGTVVVKTQPLFQGETK